jgi:uncharacterized protein
VKRMKRKSSFAILYNELHNEGTWIFSTVTQQVHHFSYEWDVIISEALKNDELCQKLIQLGIITQASNYFEEIREYFRAKEEEARKRLHIYYTITTKCEYKCNYCFQNHLNRQDTSTEVINRFSHLLSKKLDNHQEIQEVIVNLFGGEPLFRLDLCLYLLNEIRRICEPRKVKYRISMNTNGTDANSEKLDLLKAAGLEKVQITFDGSMELHNKTRGRISSNINAYETTLENLTKFSNNFSVWIKYNLNKQNINCFEELITDLKIRNLVIPLKIEALHKTLTVQDPSLYFNSNDPDLARAYLTLAHTAQRNGMMFDISSLFLPPCMISSSNSFMIEPDGTVSMCISAYEMNAFTLGNVFEISSLDFDKTSVNRSILEGAKKLCIKKRCHFFPICETGCFFMKYLHKIDFNESFCRENFYATLLPGLIHLETMKRNRRY